MKNYRKVVISILIAAMMLAVSLTMYADDFSVSATHDIDSVTANSEIVVSLKASKPISGATVYLSYDKDVLELTDVTSSEKNFDLFSEVEDIKETDNVSYAYKKDTSSVEMFSLHFKLKSGVYSVDELTVRFENISATEKKVVDGKIDYTEFHPTDYIWRYTICKNHVWQTVSETNATCTKDGIRKLKCANCPETDQIVWQVKLGHDYKQIVVDPTCTEKGYTENDCSRCTSSYRSDEKEALGHNYENKGSTTTCGKLGVTTYTCSVCQSSYNVDDKETPAHTYETVTTASTCTTYGKDVHTCKECGYVKVDEHTSLGAHKYENKVTAPTCTEKGVTVVICSVCNDVDGEYEINAAGHDFSEWKTEIAATIEKEGIAKRTCKDCGESETKKLDKLISTPVTGGGDDDNETPSWMIILIIILVIGIVVLVALLIATYITFNKKREARK